MEGINGGQQKWRANDVSLQNLFAKVIAAEGEHKASRALRMAAEVIMDSPAALQVGAFLGLGGCDCLIL